MGKSTKAIALTAGLAGVAGLAALVSAPNQVSAATTGTVTYQQGATTVWQTPAFNQVKRYVLFNQRIAIQGSKVVNGAIWYQIGANEWIPAIYLQADDGQTANANAAADQATSSNSASDTEVGSYTLTVTYEGGATTVWASTHYQTATGRYLTAGQQVTAVAKTTSNGETWYRLSSGGYVPARFTSENGEVAAPAATPAPAASAAPVASAAAPAASSAAPAASSAAPAASSAAPVASTATTVASSAPQAVTPAVTAGSFNLTVNYAGAVTVWNAPSFTTASGKYLSNGQKVTANGKVTAGGATWYQLTSGGYVPANTVTTGTVAAPAAPAAPAATATPAAPAASAATPAPVAKPATTTSVASKPATATPAPAATATLSRAAKVQRLISTARAEIGKPYLWGSKGPNSFDCSGLMYYTFKNALGITLGGYTGTQQNNGTRISMSQVQAGDLIFWATNGTPYHVALAIGNNQYINAVKPGVPVQIGTISQYFNPSFAVRVAF